MDIPERPLQPPHHPEPELPDEDEEHEKHRYDEDEVTA